MRIKSLVGLFFCFVLLLSSNLYATTVKLSDVPDYDWWYGCAPTSAGMMMGYYDIHGYKGLSYDNLVPGGVAELTTYPSTKGNWEYKAQNIIASQGHVDDFYSSGDGASGDDADPPYHSFNSLADFMGTSQDSLGNPNGATTFYFKEDGSPLYVSDVYQWGPDSYNQSGMFGIWEYVDFRGYGSHDPENDHTLFNQYVDTYTGEKGFTFNDFMSEIDAGRVVLVHVEGHTMLGYGYDSDTQTIYIHDTWKKGDHTMTWGGNYDGHDLIGVTCFIPTGGTPVPLPGAVWLLGSGLLPLVWRIRE
ncbi:hypothetical protein JCM12298_28660 [Desulfothermus naphthae]